MPALSDEGQAALDAYATALRTTTDASAITVRNYLSDLRQFIAWAEAAWEAGHEETIPFTPAGLSTPLLTRYRSYLQHTRHLTPATINRALVSLKRYSAWLLSEGLLTRDPVAPVKLIPSAKTGAALTARGLGYLVAKYAALAQVADLSPHDLRHRFGYRMAAHVPLHRLAQIMGHDSLDTTLLYIRGTARDLQNEVEKIAWE